MIPPLPPSPGEETEELLLSFHSFSKSFSVAGSLSSSQKEPGSHVKMGIIMVLNACDCSQEKCLAQAVARGQSAISENCYYFCDLLLSFLSFTLLCPDKQRVSIKWSWIKHLLFCGIITNTIPNNCELFWPPDLSYYCQSPVLSILCNKLEDGLACKSSLFLCCASVCVYLHLHVIYKVQTRCKALCYGLYQSHFTTNSNPVR